MSNFNFSQFRQVSILDSDFYHCHHNYFSYLSYELDDKSTGLCLIAIKAPTKLPYNTKQTSDQFSLIEQGHKTPYLQQMRL